MPCRPGRRSTHAGHPVSCLACPFSSSSAAGPSSPLRCPSNPALPCPPFTHAQSASSSILAFRTFTIIESIAAKVCLPAAACRCLLRLQHGWPIIAVCTLLNAASARPCAGPRAWQHRDRRQLQQRAGLAAPGADRGRGRRCSLGVALVRLRHGCASLPGFTVCLCAAFAPSLIGWRCVPAAVVQQGLSPGLRANSTTSLPNETTVCARCLPAESNRNRRRAKALAALGELEKDK